VAFGQHINICCAFSVPRKKCPWIPGLVGACFLLRMCTTPCLIRRSLSQSHPFRHCGSLSHLSICLRCPIALLGSKANCVGTVWQGKEKGDALREIATQLNGPTLVQKGAADGICDGKVTAFCDTRGSNRRAGGQVGPNNASCRILATHHKIT
jgi:hypothetical protein